MTSGWRPWRSLLLVWLPAVALCLGNLALYSWQSSKSLGREAQLKTRLAGLETSLVRLRRMQHDAAEERARVDSLNGELKRLREEVFGSLDDRLTGILRAIGTAVTEAGLRPGRYSYSWSEEKEVDLTRFGIQFSVTGEYSQLRRLLAALQSNPEFLIVDHLTLSGEEQATSRALRIGVSLSTFLAKADRQRLEQLAGKETKEHEAASTEQPTPTTGAQASGVGDGVE